MNGPREMPQAPCVWAFAVGLSILTLRGEGVQCNTLTTPKVGYANHNGSRAFGQVEGCTAIITDNKRELTVAKTLQRQLRRTKSLDRCENATRIAVENERT